MKRFKKVALLSCLVLSLSTVAFADDVKSTDVGVKTLTQAVSDGDYSTNPMDDFPLGYIDPDKKAKTEETASTEVKTEQDKVSTQAASPEATAQQAATQTNAPEQKANPLPEPDPVVIPPVSMVSSCVITPEIASTTIAPRFDFDWQKTELGNALYAVAKAAGKNVAINNKLTGTVSLSLSQKTFDEALNILAMTFNFNWMVEGDTILISTGDTMLQSKRFDLKYATLKLVKDELTSLGISEKGINTNSEYNSISVTGTPYAIAAAEKRINELDKPVAQCLIIAQLIEITHGDSLSLGAEYTMPSYSYSKSSDDVTKTLSYSITTEAEKTFSKGKVLARPIAVTINGQEATINMGSKVPVFSSTTTSTATEVTVTYQDVGDVLKVTPVINKDEGTIGLTIDTEISSITSWSTSGSVSAPKIATRTAKTTARIKAGQTLVIGGLMSSTEIDNLQGIPGLMDIPILGQLFKYHSKSTDNSEVFVLVTPYIVTDDMDMLKIKGLVTNVK